ncbi:MAG: hypothetical protein IJU80_12310 [Lachnospiraceae bacterium]|nr:hypothetical protein [Lachnospiraceae bacterium]
MTYGRTNGYAVGKGRGGSQERKDAMPPKVNAEGKIYPWAIEGKNFTAYDSINKFTMQLPGIVGILGEEKLAQASMMGNYLREIPTGNPILNGADHTKILGLQNTYDPSIKLGDLHEGYRRYLTKNQEGAAQEIYDRSNELVKETSTYLRNLYKKESDLRSIHMQEKADELADWYELQAQVANPKSGNIAEAEMNAPYLPAINMLAGAAPKYDMEGFEKCIDALEQNGVEGGKSIYDDYFTVISSGARETQIQFHRQQMEQDGWDAEKEQIYLSELKRSHDKTIEAFDRLWEIEDKGQYDDVLNNTLDHMIGKQPKDQRDANYAIGYMRGESKAIDMGYDSKHLYVLAQVGMQEQYVKKMEAELDHQLTETKDKAKIQKIKEQKEQIAEYKKDFEQLKESVWNQRVSGKEEMEAVGKQVDDFLAAHQEKYASFQLHQTYNKIMLDYQKEEAKKAEPIPRKGVHYKEANIATESANLLYSFTGDMGMLVEVSQVADAGNQINHDGTLKERKNKQLLEVADRVDQKLKEEYEKADKASDEIMHAASFKKALINHQRQCMENLKNGIPMKNDNENLDWTFGVSGSVMAQLNTDLLKTGGEEKLEKAISETGLDKFVEKGNQMQKLHQEYLLKKGDMTAAERQNALMTLNLEKREVIEMAKELKDKLANPSAEVKELFVNPQQLKDYQGQRGLQGLIDLYTADLRKVDLPQKENFDKALEKFNTSRASIFRRESDEHIRMREQAEIVQKNLTTLEAGKVPGPKKGDDRPLTEKERSDLIQKTWAAIEELDRRTDTYIASSTKNGTKVPNTPTGKERLAGARELKDLNWKVKQSLAKDIFVQDQMESERCKQIAEKEKQNAEKEKQKDHVGSTKRMDAEYKQFQKLSQTTFHDKTPESGAFGLNEWQYQAAKVIAIAGVKNAHANGEIETARLDVEMQKATRDIARDRSFQNWIKEVSESPKKMENLGKMSPDEVKAEFVNSLSKEMNKEPAGPKMEGPVKESRKTEPKKEAPKKEEPKKEVPKKEVPKKEVPQMGGLGY